MKVEVLTDLSEEDAQKYRSANRLADGSQGVENVVNIILKNKGNRTREIELIKKDGSKEHFYNAAVVGVKGEKMTVKAIEEKEHTEETTIRENVIGVWKELHQDKKFKDTSTTFVIYCYNDKGEGKIENHSFEDGTKLIVEHPMEGKFEKEVKNQETFESFF